MVRLVFLLLPGLSLHLVLVCVVLLPKPLYRFSRLFFLLILIFSVVRASNMLLMRFFRLMVKSIGVLALILLRSRLLLWIIMLVIPRIFGLVSLFCLVLMSMIA